MPQSGTLTVSAKAVIKDGQRKGEVRIQDTGYGIEDEIMNQIFEPFFSTKKAEGGTGIGLSVVRDIVKRHSGEIQINSEQGKGTEFVILLPMNGE